MVIKGDTRSLDFSTFRGWNFRLTDFDGRMSSEPSRA